MPEIRRSTATTSAALARSAALAGALLSVALAAGCGGEVAQPTPSPGDAPESLARSSPSEAAAPGMPAAEGRNRAPQGECVPVLARTSLDCLTSEELSPVARDNYVRSPTAFLSSLRDHSWITHRTEMFSMCESMQEDLLPALRELRAHQCFEFESRADEDAFWGVALACGGCGETEHSRCRAGARLLDERECVVRAPAPPPP